MPSALIPSNPASGGGASRARRGLNGAAVLGELELLRSSLQPGEQFPSQRELVRRLDASERAVAWALDELARQGKIVKRVGRGGTFVSDTPVDSGSSGIDDNVSELPVQSRTIVAISEPDGSIFDRALQLLVRHPEAAELAINSRLMAHTNIDRFELPSAQNKPLGFLLFRHLFEPLALRLQEAGHRVVLVGQPSNDQGAGVPNVYGDHTEGGALVVRHLLDLGHRRLLFQDSGLFRQTRRWKSAKHTLEQCGLATSHELLSDEMYARWSKSPQLVREFFDRPDAPTAVVAWNDEKAINLLTLLNKVGLRVPEDVSLVGYDNLPQSVLTHPALTTVDSAIERQLHAALRLLLQPESPSPNHTVIVLPSLLRRDSSAPLEDQAAI
ncbi:GntR family transcriptional regulator [bacterium]|nr:MAG: GntR family transcriptional regulator [bacterium]